MSATITFIPNIEHKNSVADNNQHEILINKTYTITKLCIRYNDNGFELIDNENIMQLHNNDLISIANQQYLVHISYEYNTQQTKFTTNSLIQNINDHYANYEDPLDFLKPTSSQKNYFENNNNSVLPNNYLTNLPAAYNNSHNELANHNDNNKNFRHDNMRKTSDIILNLLGLNKPY